MCTNGRSFVVGAPLHVARAMVQENKIKGYGYIGGARIGNCDVIVFPALSMEEDSRGEKYACTVTTSRLEAEKFLQTHSTFSGLQIIAWTF